jgi:hypothetical protein
MTLIADLLSPFYAPALAAWHQLFPAPVRWRLTVAGVDVQPPLAAPSGDMTCLLNGIWLRYGDPIANAAQRHQVPPELIAACIATESSGCPDSVRFEPGYVADQRTPDRVSVGLMQTLISTARDVLPGVAVDRQWLLEAANSIDAGAAYMARQYRLTGYDPPLVAAAYNAGRLRREATPGNPWRLLCYPRRTGTHVSRFVRHYNAALSTRPSSGPVARQGRR